jgi:hypothetical protein
MRVPILCLIVSLAATATAQTRKPAPRSSAPARPAASPPKPATAPAHFSASGLNDEDDLLRIYSGDFQSVHLDRDGSGFMLIISGYMEDFARDCKQFLPPNKVEITQQVCNDGPSVPTPSPDGVHDNYGNLLPNNTGCSSYRTEGTGLFADPQLYSAVQAVGLRTQVHMAKSMLGIPTGNDGRPINPLNVMQQLTDQLVASSGDTKALIQANGCGSPGLKNFQTNLIRFANSESPIKFAGAVLAPSAPGGPAKDADFTRLINDLVAENARGWLMNRYQPGSVADPIVEHDPLGHPTRIMARYTFAGTQGKQQGRVTVSFKDGAPDCLYFSDAPDNCRAASQRVVSAYQRNAYAKYSGAAADAASKSPLATSCNVFFHAPKTSRFAPPDPDGYCTCISNGYRGVMTPAQETFYANNFEDKFWRGIAQPTSNDDPAWPRLNPIAVSCMQ